MEMKMAKNSGRQQKTQAQAGQPEAADQRSNAARVIDEQNASFWRMVCERVSEDAADIARLGRHFDILIMVIEPSERARRVLPKMGWNGQGVFAMEREVLERYAMHVDPLTRNWLTRARREDIGILLFTHDGTILMNLHCTTGITVEPGSLDREWMS
jgi:hypothetical protein